MNLTGLTMILADAAPAAVPATEQNPKGILPLLLGYGAIFIGMIYFMSLRPQNKKAKEFAAMMSAMKPGDKVVTGSGIIGTVVSIKEKSVAIRSAETKLEVLKSAITTITERVGDSGSSES